MSGWSWVAKTLRNLRLTGVGSTAAAGTPNSRTSTPSSQSRSTPLFSAQPPPISVPPKPKKPLTPYFRFMSQVRDDVKKQNPDLKMTDLMKKVGEQWEKLDPAAKQPFLSAYKTDMEAYSTVLDRYRRSLSPEQQVLEQQMKIERQLRKERRERKKKFRELGKPKKPLTGFLLFMRSKLPSGASIKEQQQLARDIGAQWKNLSEQEKAPWIKKYQEAHEDYEKQLKKWEDKMIKQGNEDLVRIASLTKKVRASASASGARSKH